MCTSIAVSQKVMPHLPSKRFPIPVPEERNESIITDKRENDVNSWFSNTSRKSVPGTLIPSLTLNNSIHFTTEDKFSRSNRVF